jgi:putative transcriptional regulator
VIKLKTITRQLRISKGWTQPQLATALGKSVDYVKSVESGRCTPSLPMARKVADVFGCETIDEILQAS